MFLNSLDRNMFLCSCFFFFISFRVGLENYLERLLTWSHLASKILKNKVELNSRKYLFKVSLTFLKSFQGILEELLKSFVRALGDNKENINCFKIFSRLSLPAWKLSEFLIDGDFLSSHKFFNLYANDCKKLSKSGDKLISMRFFWKTSQHSCFNLTRKIFF